MAKAYGRLNKHKEEFIRILMSDQILLKFLYYKDNSSDILSKPDLTVREKAMLKSKNIFEYRKLPTENNTEVDTYLSMEFGMNRYQNKDGNKYFTQPTIYVYTVANNQLDDTSNGSRIYAIEDRLVELFHYEKNETIIGYSVVVASEDLNLPSPYVGRKLMIRFADRNDKEWNN